MLPDGDVSRVIKEGDNVSEVVDGVDCAVGEGDSILERGMVS
jgi:hypothetical protein